MFWPDLSIVVITFQRPDEIRRVIRSLKSWIKYAGVLRWWLADDGSQGSYVRDIVGDFPELGFSISITDRKGWGANVNACLSRITTDFTFQIEDDYVPKRDINLAAGVSLLMAAPSFGLVRYDGVEGHMVDLALRETNTQIGRLGYLGVAKGSPALYVYSNRPHLKHRRFHAAYGLYPEGRKLGDTEEAFAIRVKGLAGGPVIVTLLDGIERAFDDIGHSWKGTGFDVGHS